MNVAITPEEVSSLYGTPGVARYYFPTSATTLKAFWEGGITPTIVVNPTELTFTSTQGVEASKTLTVSGSNLTNTITLALSGTNAELFSLSATSLPSAGGTVTVKYKPVATGSHMAHCLLVRPEQLFKAFSLTGTSTVSGPTVPTLTKNMGKHEMCCMTPPCTFTEPAITVKFMLQMPLIEFFIRGIPKAVKNICCNRNMWLLVFHM